jgi:hypothetical protein
MTLKHKPISSSNPPESKGIRTKEPEKEMVKDFTPPKIVPTDSLERFEKEEKKSRAKKKTE